MRLPIGGLLVEHMKHTVMTDGLVVAKWLLYLVYLL